MLPRMTRGGPGIGNSCHDYGAGRGGMFGVPLLNTSRLQGPVNTPVQSVLIGFSRVCSEASPVILISIGLGSPSLRMVIQKRAPLNSTGIYSQASLHADGLGIVLSPVPSRRPPSHLDTPLSCTSAHCKTTATPNPNPNPVRRGCLKSIAANDSFGKD